MARIRSVHPSLFTDEVFMGLTMPARVFLIGLWTEADDHGVFEWKPITLKARLLPADNLSTDELLAELSTSNVIVRQQEGGGAYGLIRNFCRYQRPKSPAYKHPFPQEWGKYVGLKVAPTPAPPQNSPSPTEKTPLMEEGGKEEGSPPNPPQAGGADASQGDGGKRPSRADGTNPRSTAKAREEARQREEAAAFAEARRAKWSPRLAEYRDTGLWQTAWGSEPWTGNSGCLVPPDMREAFTAIWRARQDAFALPDNLRRADQPVDEAAAIDAHYREITARRTA